MKYCNLKSFIRTKSKTVFGLIVFLLVSTLTYSQVTTDDVILECIGTASPVSYDLPDATGGSAWSVLYSPSGSAPTIGASSGTLTNMTHAGMYIAVLDGGSATDTVEIAVPACDLPCVDDGATGVGYVDWSPLGTVAINGPSINQFTVTLPGHTDIDVTQTLPSGLTRQTVAFTKTNKPSFEMLGYAGGTNQTMYVETGANDVLTVEFDFKTPIADFDFLIFDVDQDDQVTIRATDINDNVINDLSNWIVRSTGDATQWESGGPNTIIAPPPVIDLSTGSITASHTSNFNRSFVALRPDRLLKSLTLEYTTSISGNHVYLDFYGTLASHSVDCGASCAVTNPYPGFPIDFSNNNTGWLDYSLATDMVLFDNDDGTMTLSGHISDGTPVDFGSGSNGSSCGTDDGWHVVLTLSDKQDWATFQAAGGSANVHANCTSQISSLDYWDVTGTLIGTGCNADRTLTINGPVSPYRFQIGNGGNSGDGSCSFGMSTWFDMSEGSNSYPSDIYAFIDEACFITSNPGVIAGDETKCSAYDPSEILSYEDPESGSGFSYAWHQSTDGNSWTTIAGATELTYDPSTISNTTYYRRVLYDDQSSTFYSNVVEKIVDGSLIVCPDELGWQFDCDNRASVGMAGVGIKGQVNPGARVLNGSFKDYYLVRATFDGGTDSPESVTFSNLEGDTKTATLQYLNGESGVNGKRYFEAILPPSDSIFVNHKGDINTGESLIVYTVQSVPFSTSSNKVDAVGTYVNEVINPGEEHTVSIPLPEVLNHRKIYMSLPLTGVVDDGSEVYVEMSVGGTTQVDTITTFTNSNSLELVYINLSEITPEATTLTIKVSSPSTNGQTILLSGAVSVSVTCDDRLVILAEGDGSCPGVGDTMTYTYTVYNFASFPIFNLGGNSSLTGSIDFGQDSIGSNSQIITTVDYVVQESDVPELVNYISVAGFNFPANGIKGIADNVRDTIALCENCVNGVDDDGDTLVDCADPDCTDGSSVANLSALDPGICRDSSTDLVLVTRGPSTITWSTGETVMTTADTVYKTVAPSSSTTYSVTVTDADQCDATGSVAVTVTAPVLAVINTPLSITCDNSSVDLVANPANMSYAWSHGATDRTTTVTQPGIYSLTVTNSAGCEDDVEVHVIDNTGGPIVSLENVETCGPEVELIPQVCEQYGDMIAKRNLQRNGWNNQLGDIGSALVGDGELCFTVDSLFNSTPQMLGLSDNPGASRSHGNIDYAIYIRPRLQINQYYAYVFESGSNRGLVYSGASYVGSEFCVRRTGTTVEYFKDGVLLHTSSVASTQDLYFDNSFHSAINGTWANSYSSFRDISLCGELDMAGYQWSTGETTPTITTAGIGGYTVTVTDAFGCTETATSIVSSKVTDLSTSIDYNGNICVSSNAQISGQTTGGTAPYTYEWTGPNSYTADTETITISDNGNYYMTVTDAEGCQASTSGFVYEAYEPTIVTLQTEVCEGEAVSLNVNSSSATSYQWSSNADDLTTSNVTVYPEAPSSTYYVTVTSDLGCTAVAEATIDANAVPTTDAGSNRTICQGQSVTLSATLPTVGEAPFSFDWSGGAGSGQSVTFTPSGSSLTNVTSTYTVTVTDDSGCSSTDDVSVVVTSTPTVTLSQTPASCGESTGTIVWDIYDHPNRTNINLSINGGVDWTYVADNIGSYEFAGLDAGTYDTRVKWGDNSCPVDISDITVESIDKPEVSITGDADICVGSYTTLSPSSGGIWSSSNTSVATVSTAGIVTGVAAGSATFTFTDSSTGCTSDPSGAVTIGNVGVVTLSGDQNICSGSTTTITASTAGGTYSSSDNSIATVTNSGVVTALTGGVVTITYDHGGSSCVDNPTIGISITERPVAVLTGDDELCVGEYSTVTPSTGGVWSTSDASVATVSNTGVITAVGVGTVTFQYLHGNSGCVSEYSAELTVTDVPTIAIDYNGSQCITDDSQLGTIIAGGTAPYTYVWQLPDGSSDSGPTIDIDQNGAYYVTVTDSKGCSANSSGYLYQQYEAFIINLQSEVCEGEQVTLAASASNGSQYNWSANAGGGTSPTVTVTPSLPSSEYMVTVTNSQGCEAVATATIDVIAEPTVSVEGPGTICQGETTTLSPSTGGIWVSSNPTVATVSYSGVVTGVSEGTANFIFTDVNTGCESSSNIAVTIRDNPTPAYTGSTEICIGETTTVSPTTGGTWTSTNEQVATITDSGVITAVGSGTANFVYQDASTTCTAAVGQNLVVNGRPSIVVQTDTPLCIGGTSSAFPSTGGIWVSSDDDVATINNTGAITAVSAGKAVFTYTNLMSGCSSLPSDSMTVAQSPTVTVTGLDSICVGDNTTLSPAVGGSWQSTNPAVAQVSNSGVVTAMMPGSAAFIFTDASTGCVSDATDDVVVLSAPVVSIIGDNSICVGETSYLSPSTGGVWQSNNEEIATVTPDGVVTALVGGAVSFTFTSQGSGCGTATSDPITVYNQPVISLQGPSEICVGTSTSLQPSTGGLWSSSDNSVATISTTGQVTGISAGDVTFTFTETGSDCSSEESLMITIVPQPIASITGSNTICVGSTSSVSPTTGGIWLSTAPSVATVTPDGVVTAISQGVARFTFISDAGCSSNQTLPIIIIGDPEAVLINGNNTCIGSTLAIQPSTGGTWSSSDEQVATITDQGIITGVGAGVVTFTYVDNTTGCSSDESEPVTIEAGPEGAVIGSDNICIGESTNLAPTVGGVWSSSDPAVAIIDNTGAVTAISAGSATFTYTEVGTGCVSDAVGPVVVESGPIIAFDGSDILCIGGSSSMTPSTGGTWTSTNTSVATITPDGNITALAQGIARFVYTDAATGCQSELSDPLTVNPPPSVSTVGDDQVCIGGVGYVAPAAGGTWTSSDPLIATVTAAGEVTGLSSGMVTLQYTDTATGCESIPLPIEVVAAIQTSIAGESDICIGGYTTLLPNTGGIWISNNPAIATVTNEGIVTGRASGEVTFTFTDASTGCSDGSTTEPVMVSKCINHDFNVTMVNMPVSSSIARNDNEPTGTSYSSAVTTISKPSASLAILTVNPDGSYVFSANKAGKYIYHVPVCIPPSAYGCHRSLLEITVLDDIYNTSNAVANLDLAETYGGSDHSFELLGQANDRCVQIGGCIIDFSNMTINHTPTKGAVATSSDGSVTYTPYDNAVGKDTVGYTLCSADGSNCTETYQIINIKDDSSINGIYAADDFAWGMVDNDISGNVITNDGDAEGDAITVTAQGSVTNPISIAGGSYYITSTGDFTFTPDPGFSGNAEIAYTVCDDASDMACMQATAHLLVFADLSLSIKVYLEGALIGTDGDETAAGHPRMRDDLRSNRFNNENYIPLADPYQFAVSPILDYTSKFTHVGAGLLPENQFITDSAAVFSVTGDDAIVDWVFVEVRSKEDMTEVLATRSGLVQRDADVVDLDGVSPLRFKNVNADSFYVVVKHRSHLGAMSMLVGNGELVDFTDVDTDIFNYGTTMNATDYSGLSQNTMIKPGYNALWGGDMNCDGLIKFTNPDDDHNWLFFDVLLIEDNVTGVINYNFGYGYYNGDYNMDGRVKYTNPDDDTNYLFFQVLLYPKNDSFFSNYSFFIEQVPR